MKTSVQFPQNDELAILIANAKGYSSFSAQVDSINLISNTIWKRCGNDIKKGVLGLIPISDSIRPNPKFYDFYQQTLKGKDKGLVRFKGFILNCYTTKIGINKDLPIHVDLGRLLERMLYFQSYGCSNLNKYEIEQMLQDESCVLAEKTEPFFKSEFYLDDQNVRLKLIF